jgi:DNA polymerase
MKKEVETYFKHLKAIGVEYVEKDKPRKAPGKTKNPAAPSSLASIAAEVAGCVKCRLHKTRTQTVFGSGDPKARVMFVGEAPGADEDEQGLPFVGRAGKLLTSMIEAERSLGIPRSAVYIANVLKCRPPENRPPEPDEVAQCEGYLKAQIALVKPSFICALGAHAAHTLLKTNEPIGKLRGRWHEYEGIPLVATYHPSFLNRAPQYKAESWKDLLMLKEALNAKGR